MIFCYNSNSRWQHSDNKNLDSPYFTDNLNTPDNMSKNTHTKLFKLQFSGASGNNNNLIHYRMADSDWYAPKKLDTFGVHIFMSRKGQKQKRYSAEFKIVINIMCNNLQQLHIESVVSETSRSSGRTNFIQRREAALQVWLLCAEIDIAFMPR